MTAQSQRQSRSLADELCQLAQLGGPIALVQLGLNAMGVVDVAFLGHFDPASLPAMALGNGLSWTVLGFTMGTITAIDPLLAQAVGARDGEAVQRALLRGAVLATLLLLPAALVLLPAGTWFTLLGQKPELVPAATTFAQLSTLGFLPFLWFCVLRSLLSAHSRLLPVLVAIVLGNACNALLDWLLVFGHCGLPALGVRGAAWATICSRTLMFAGLAVGCWPDLQPHLRALADPGLRRAVLAPRPLWRLLCLGVPIGAQFALEGGVFVLTAFLIGRMDAAAGADEVGGPRLGGHQIALQLASMSFMVPLGLGMAAAVRVGWAVGRGDTPGARRSAGAALLAGALVMAGFMALFLGAPRLLVQLFTDDVGMATWGVLLLPIAGVFQIGDGVQVTAIGCLRGIGDVRSPMYANVVGFWLVGLPLGCWLAFGYDQGPAGLWWGLVVGLFAVAIALLWAVRLRFSEQQERLDLEDHR